LLLSMISPPIEREHGFSLLEVLCATAILTTGLAALAQLVIVSTRVNSSAKTTTVATVMAVQKMEQLRSLAWEASPSPPGALTRNSSGYCDFLDRRGQSIGGGSSSPPGTAYIRRWSIEPLPADPGNSLVLQVRVTAGPARPVDDTAGVGRRPDEVRLVTVKTRKGQ
jgi:prepilin-type N-terminal cleavage/methylation domain-containing protein